MREVDRIILDQSGLIARRQAMGAGLSTSDIARRIRRREWAMVHPGVFVDHTGELSWLQRAWAAVLYSWPAALCHESAIRAAEGPGRRDRDDAVVHVAVARSRHLVAPPGVRLHRSAVLLENVRWNLGPPRVRYEDAVLDAAADATSDLRSVAILADACGSRRTTALRLLAVAEARARLPRRTWLTGILTDVASGTCSVLEHGYLTRVERPHGLPRGERQVSHRHDATQVFRDVEYRRAGVVVELDGRLFHSSVAKRDADMDRDLDAASEGRETLRVSYGQVFDRACWTAGRVGAVLTRNGWAGTPRPCAECG